MIPVKLPYNKKLSGMPNLKCQQHITATCSLTIRLETASSFSSTLTLPMLHPCLFSLISPSCSEVLSLSSLLHFSIPHLNFIPAAFNLQQMPQFLFYRGRNN
jgi:hypothetical protein